ncbi:MAG: ParA family protein [Burkholderiales bacterium]
MKILMFANQKGGVGKSTLAYNFAFYLAEETQKRILFIDSDTQGNSSSSLKSFMSDLVASKFFGDAPIPFQQSKVLITVARADDGLKDIERVPDSMGSKLVERLKARLAEASRYFDYCVVDTPGSNTNSVGAFLLNASHIVVPTEIDKYNVDVSINMIKRIVGVQKSLNKNLVNLGMLPSRLKPGAVNQRRDLEGLLRDFHQYVLQAYIFDRIAYKEAAYEGVPVWKYTKRQKRDSYGKALLDDNQQPIMERVSNEAAANEIRAAFALIKKKMEG